MWYAVGLGILFRNDIVCKVYIYRTDKANLDKYGLLLPMVSAK